MSLVKLGSLDSHRLLGNHDRYIRQCVQHVCVPTRVRYYTAARTHCRFAAHHVFVILDGVYRVLQTLSPFLFGKHIDGDVRRLVVDVTDLNDERDITYAFVRREYTFEGISGDDIDGATLSQGIYGTVSTSQ